MPEYGQGLTFQLIFRGSVNVSLSGRDMRERNISHTVVGHKNPAKILQYQDKTLKRLPVFKWAATAQLAHVVECRVCNILQCTHFSVMFYMYAIIIV